MELFFVLWLAPVYVFAGLDAAVGGKLSIRGDYPLAADLPAGKLPFGQHPADAGNIPADLGGVLGDGKVFSLHGGDSSEVLPREYA